jgi:hypothetical protein
MGYFVEWDGAGFWYARIKDDARSLKIYSLTAANGGEVGFIVLGDLDSRSEGGS